MPKLKKAFYFMLGLSVVPFFIKYSVCLYLAS